MAELPTDAQREQWDRFEAASKQAAAETAHLSGMARAVAKAKRTRELLSDEEPE